MTTRSDTNHLCGASHPRAKLSTSQVDSMCDAYETENKSYATLAAQYQCGVATVRDIVLYRTRCAG